MRIAIFADEAILEAARFVVPSVIHTRQQIDAVLSSSVPVIRFSFIPIEIADVSDLSMSISHHEFPLKRRRGAWEFTLSSSPDIDSMAIRRSVACVVRGVCKQCTYTKNI